nr:protein asteroid-like isoform X1 [Procambarus clarkii]
MLKKMGVRGLSTYIREHLSEALERHKLHHCNVIIDGNNLAHILYFACTGINASFGGDYDKYASYVEKYFEGLQSCEIYSIVVMDGGQPLDMKKLRTVRQRIQNQIQMCIRVEPSNQYKSKIFPCMGRQVFVTTLQRMGITVVQTDFEADEEIAMLSKILGYTVLSNDSDFYMYDVPLVMLDSTTNQKISTSKNKKPIENYKYLSCYHFSVDKFCELTKMDRAHLPLLATLLGNDYLSMEVFTDFYAQLGEGRKATRMSDRHKIIKDVITWLANRKGQSMEYLVSVVSQVAGKKKLKQKILQSVNHYTEMKTNLLNYLNPDGLIKSHSSLHSDSSLAGRSLLKETALIKSSEVETALILKNGKKLPAWFMEAYRTHRIPHEVADILTQSYFISPPQVEDISAESSYLVVEPIVRSVCRLLWQDVSTHDYNHKYHYGCKDKDGELLAGMNDLSISVDQYYDPCTSNEMYDSDVVIEEDEEDSDDQCTLDKSDDSDFFLPKIDETNLKHITNNEVDEIHQTENLSGEHVIGVNENCELNEEVNEKEREKKVSEDKCKLGVNKKTKVQYLKWYLRKNNRIWIKNLSFLSDEKANKLPSLDDVTSMSVFDKKKVFYSVFETNTEFTDLDLPGDLELILDFIIFWFRRSKLPLKDCHALAVLMCIFMYYIIDSKIGRVRTRKAFEVVDTCKTKISDFQNDASYSWPDAGVKDLLAHTSDEECLVAAFNLFQFHHQDPRVTDKYYSRKTVHAFCEYQACIYFLQLLNSLLCLPFPMLSVECLWGGTFCYNIFSDLKRRSNPVVRITELLGKGTCLQRLFLILFKRLGETLNFKKSVDMVEVVQNSKLPKKKSKEENKITEQKTTKNIKINKQENINVKVTKQGNKNTKISEQDINTKISENVKQNAVNTQTMSSKNDKQQLTRDGKLSAKEKNKKKRRREQLQKEREKGQNDKSASNEQLKDQERVGEENVYLLENRFAELVSDPGPVCVD